MVEDPLNEDQWLYGDSNDANEQINGAAPEAQPAPAPPPELPAVEEPPPEEEPPAPPQENDEEIDEQESFNRVESNDMTADIRPPGEELEEGEDEDSDDSDDNVQVTIGDIKTAPQYGNLNIKRNTIINTGIEKQQRLAAGKFSIDDFESIGTINGVPVHEYSIDALEDKPWRKPGADITDYFNYGFNEETWRAYCERQKTMRVRESGVGLGGLGMTRTTTTVFTAEGVKHGPVPVVVGRKVVGPPTEPRRAGIIEVIGSSAVASRRANEVAEEENAIQVLTADKRDYGRKVSGYDMSVPPPNFDPSIPPVVNYGGYPSQQEFYPPEMSDPYYQHYDRPAQNMAWLPPEKPDNSMPEGVVIKQEPADKPSKDRERDREYDRHKERSRRHRSRSRSSDRRRKHKSRSRSPHRTHKKKKSKKSERERSRDRDRSRSRERSRDRDRSRDRERSHTRDQERSHTRDREPSED